MFFVGLALFFYAVSWSVNEYGKTAWYIGIGLPWLSLFSRILISLLCDFMFKIDSAFDKIGWGYSYAFCSIIYVIVMSIIAKTVFPFIPHLAACACFIAEAYIEKLYATSDKREKEIKDSAEFLESKLESIDRIIIKINESGELRDRLTETLFTQTSESYRTLSKMKNLKGE